MIRLPPHLCDHSDSLLICAQHNARGSGDCAYVCEQCGMFIVWIRGEKLEFVLASTRLLNAAGRWIEYLDRSAESLERKLSE